MQHSWQHKIVYGALISTDAHRRAMLRKVQLCTLQLLTEHRSTGVADIANVYTVRFATKLYSILAKSAEDDGNKGLRLPFKRLSFSGVESSLMLLNTVIAFSIELCNTLLLSNLDLYEFSILSVSLSLNNKQSTNPVSSQFNSICIHFSTTVTLYKWAGPYVIKSADTIVRYAVLRAFCSRLGIFQSFTNRSLPLSKAKFSIYLYSMEYIADFGLHDKLTSYSTRYLNLVSTANNNSQLRSGLLTDPSLSLIILYPIRKGSYAIRQVVAVHQISFTTFILLSQFLRSRLRL